MMMMPRLAAPLLWLLVAANAAVLKRDVSGNDLEQQIGRLPELDLSRTSSVELANHTSAVIELVLQNVHRLKNFEERARLERLVTRFKTLVDELQRPPSDGATQLADELTIDDGAENVRMADPWRRAEPPAMNFYPGLSEQNAKFESNHEIKRNHDSAFGLSSDLHPTPPPVKGNKVDSPNPTTSTPLLAPLNSSSPVSQAVPTHNPIPFQGEDDMDDDLDEDEDDELGDDEDIDDDELVKELRHGSRPSDSDNLHLEFVPPGNVATPRRNQPRHRSSDPSALPLKNDKSLSADWQSFEAWPAVDSVRDVLPLAAEDSDSKASPQAIDDTEQVENDVKLLNTVISNLRQVKEVLQRMRHNR